MSNRVLAAIEKRRSLIKSGLKPDGTPITADLAEVEKGMDNTLMEVMVYQQKKNLAMMKGLLSTDEALTIYNALGGEAPSPNGWAADADLATKVVVSQIMAELMGVK